MSAGADQEEQEEQEEEEAIEEPDEDPPPEEPQAEIPAEQLDAASGNLAQSLVTLGFVAFDGQGTDNTSAGVLVSEELRRHFRRDAYVGIHDPEQGITFLGRVVEGPFHSPHEIGPDSAISRTTLLHPDRTQFRPSYYASGTIEILGEVTESETVLPTSTRPRPYSQAFIYPRDRLRRMLGLEGDMRLGTLLGYDGVMVEADSTSKGFLPRNVGIFGTVGSGKSNTTQVLMEEALRANWAVVVIDVEGEYVRMNEPNDEPHLKELLERQFPDRQPRRVPDFRVYVPSAGMSDASDPVAFKVPIADVPVDIIANIMDLTEAQIRMWNTITDRADRARPQRSSRWGTLGGPTGPARERPYTLSDLIDGVTEGDNGVFPLLGKVQTTEKITASTLKSKLFNLGHSEMLDWNPTRSIPYLNVDELLVPQRLSVFDVSETSDTARNIAIAFLLQALFERVIAVPRGEELAPGRPRPPVLLVIEEVHTFVSRANAGRMRAVLDQLQVISRRGRKRWMGLALVSQQPGHVPEELFELANTRFIHQLKSAGNLAPVRATTGGVHEALWSTVPALGQGQCLLTGSIFRNPVFVQMRPARSRRMHTT
ncbi:ATP-binding protein [Acrocarpospora catenulata]|uniref:ATP-binding protein n=1 Tax=Acrocarpospora catenulata TaxID=2836182 RepID=UPI001BDA82D3|nr:ATP-binding protein [Acrocarpospora catenulata]